MKEVRELATLTCSQYKDSEGGYIPGTQKQVQSLVSLEWIECRAVWWKAKSEK